MPHKDPEEKSRYMRARYLRKADELKAYQKDYRSKNGRKIRDRRRPYQRAVYLLSRAVRRVVLVLRRGGECARCGDNRVEILQFHHRDPTEKSFTIGVAATSNSSLKFPWTTFEAEADKCDLLCPNCHAIEHNSWSEDERKAIVDLAGRLYAAEVSLDDVRAAKSSVGIDPSQELTDLLGSY